MMKRAMVDDYRGLNYYRKLNYIPADLEEESVSKTFEYCYNDWAIAHVARKTRQNTTTRRCWSSVRRTTATTSTPRRASCDRSLPTDGSFTSPFDPIDLGHSTKWRDYTSRTRGRRPLECSMTPRVLIELFGGQAPFVAKLDGLFTTRQHLPADAPPDIAGLVGQYAHGNEPSHHIAYLYVYAGPALEDAGPRAQPDGDDVLADPDGHAGQRRCGPDVGVVHSQRTWVLPGRPVSGNYILGSPLFDQAR
jgi:putative alpha-1,2-mannosidase